MVYVTHKKNKKRKEEKEDEIAVIIILEERGGEGMGSSGRREAVAGIYCMRD